MKKLIFTLPALFLLFSGCSLVNKHIKNKRQPTSLLNEISSAEVVDSKLKTHKGFRVKLFAIVPGARSITIHPNGTIFVGTGGFSNPYDRVYRLIDFNKDNVIDNNEIEILAEGFANPNGVTLHGDDLYIGEINQIVRYKKVTEVPWGAHLRPEQFERLPIALPNETYHGWKHIKFGIGQNSDWLYYPIGAPCNVCLEEGPFNQIYRYNIKTQEIQVVAKGQRNSVGFDFHPQTGNLWFTDNGRDQAGEDFPRDELNELTQIGQNFGFPFCHGKNYEDSRQYDSEFNADRSKKCETFVEPKIELNPHGAALGLTFLNHPRLPSSLQNQILVAEHGSWNRTKKLGYQVGLARISGLKIGYEPFVWGWLDTESNEAWGRPVDVEKSYDGSFLISDDGYRDSKNPGALYRLVYTGQ